MLEKLVSLVNSREVLTGCDLSVETWMREMIIRLLELTHNMWIYHNLVVHDNATGTHALRRKEALQLEAERQLELGGEGLEEGDKWMLEVNWSGMEESTGKREAYWLLAIEAAREYNTKGSEMCRHQIPLERDCN